jgi:hypothetical protein
VRAATEIGIGEVSSITLFTQEGVPTKSVSNVVAAFKDSNSVKVSWMPLTYGEARGFPLYIIRYTSDDGSITGSVNTTDSSVTIEGLNPQLAFTFTVQITTGNGNNLGPSTTSKKCYRVHAQQFREQHCVWITLLQLHNIILYILHA